MLQNGTWPATFQHSFLKAIKDQFNNSHVIDSQIDGHTRVRRDVWIQGDRKSEACELPFPLYIIFKGK